MSKPQAHERKQHRKSHTPLGAEIFIGTDTIRTAHCGQDGHSPTSNFIGANESGWAFRCRGGMRDGSASHTFVAQPAQPTKGKGDA